MAMKKGGAVLRKFNYLKLMELSLSVNIYHMIAKIHEYKGKQELYVENYPDILEKMIDVAKIQSTKSSNAIEGIYTNDRSEEHTSELQSRQYLVCRLLLEKKKTTTGPLPGSRCPT